MEVMRLEFMPEIKDELLKILGSFSADELKIIYEDSDFENEKRKVQNAYEKLKRGNMKLYTLEEADEILKKTISKNES